MNFVATNERICYVGIINYMHVVDLIKGQVKAAQAFDRKLKEVIAINLGTGNGQSVMQLVDVF